MTLRVVFLDVDDTLVDYQYAARAAFTDALGPQADYDEWLTLDHYERFLAGQLTFEQFRLTRMADFLTRLGRDAASADKVESHRFDGLERNYRLFDDALPCLERLRTRGLRIGLITNNESVHQRRKLAIVGLDRLVDAVAISEEVGAAKPDRLIFDYACAQLDVAPDEALHIGDNREADAVGAHAAGLRAVWLERRTTSASTTPDSAASSTAPDFPVISSLDALDHLLD